MKPIHTSKHNLRMNDNVLADTITQVEKYGTYATVIGLNMVIFGLKTVIVYGASYYDSITV